MRANFRSIITAVGLLFALAASISAAPGDLDPTFGNGGKVILSGYGSYDVAIQPDGKIVTVGGGGGGSEGVQITVARYNVDGSLDTTFGGTGRVFIDHYQTAIDVALQPDGKIVVASLNPEFGDIYSGELIRLNSDGSVDTSFGTNGIVAIPFFPSVAATLPDGKLLITQASSLYRLNANGSFDSTFSTCEAGGVFRLPSRTESVVQADGRIVTALNFDNTHFGVVRCNPDGGRDTSFGSSGNGIVETPIGGGLDGAPSIAIQTDGKMVVTGQGRGQLTVLRYHPNGALDSGFGTGGIATTPTVEGNWNKVVIQTNGKIVVATTILNGSKSNFALVRFNPNGSPDTTFNGTGKVITPITNGDNGARSVAIQPDGKFVVVGAGENGGNFYDLVVRYHGDSALSPSCPNPIDCPEFFVRQHYRDFLSREPEPAGFNDWVNTLVNCPPGDVACDRIKVSSAFFLSDEFHSKGYYVFRFYKAAYGTLPFYEQIIPDMGSLTAPTTQEVRQKKAAFAASFVQRAEFQNLYGALSNAAYVNALLNRYNLQSITTVDPQNPDTGPQVTLTASDLTDQLNAGTLDRAKVLRAVVDSSQVSQAESDSGFVAMQYYGYLRRTPEAKGYQDWLDTIRANPADIRSMVNGFVNSTEYRHRFGQP